MFASDRRSIVSFVLFSFGIGIAATAMGNGPLVRKTYDVRRLVPSSAIDEFTDLVQSVVEPHTWDSVGGPGTIEMKGPGAIVVGQTTATHAKLAKLLTALGKLPSLQPPRAGAVKASLAAPLGKQPSAQRPPAAKPTKPVLQIPIDDKATSDQRLVVYNVMALVPVSARGASNSEPLIEKIVSTVAPETWEHAGGTGVIRYYSRGRALVILQSPKAHEQLLKMLEQAVEKTNSRKATSIKART